MGIAEIVPVITVAPQKDICPQGRTYPRNAVAIVNIISAIPDIHVFCWFAGEEKYSPRAVCVYITRKNRDAVFVCKIRVMKPISVSFMIEETSINAFVISGE